MKRAGSQDVTIHISTASVVKVLFILLLAAVLFVLHDLLLVVLAAVIIAAAVEPMTEWFRTYRVPRVPAVLIIYIVLAVILTAIFSFLVLPLLNQMSQFLSSLPEYLSSVDLWGPLNDSFIGSQPVVQGLQENVSLREVIQNLNQTISSVSGGAINTINAVFGGLFSFVLIIVLSFYLCVQEKGIARFLSMITPRQHREYVLGLWKRSEQKIGLWLQGQLILVLIVGVLTYLGLLLLGVKHALLLAALAGIFELIPLFGPILAAIPAIVLAFIDGGATLSLLTAGFYLIIQQFENQLIYPLVVQKVVGVSPIIVILALVAGGTLAGFLGILLAVPVAAVLIEFLNDYQKGLEKQVPQS